MASFQELKAKHRSIRGEWKSSNENSANLRVHRALSWLNAAEDCGSDDVKFINLWIAFNALYGQERTFTTQHVSEKESFKKFFGKLVSYDKNKQLHGVAWENYSTHINLFIKNKFVFGPYWEFQRGEITAQEWGQKFKLSEEQVLYSFGKERTDTFLGILFERFYILRNQLMHGGATYEGGVNRDQIKDATALLSQLIPIIINLVMDNADKTWGDPSYPPIR